MKWKIRLLEQADVVCVYRAYRIGFVRSARNHQSRRRRTGNRASRKAGGNGMTNRLPGKAFGSSVLASRGTEKRLGPEETAYGTLG